MAIMTVQMLKLSVFIIFITMIFLLFKINIDTEYIKENFAPILSVIIVILGLIVFFSIIELNLNPIKNSQIEKIVSIEAFENKMKSANDKYSSSFCKSHTGNSSELNKACNDLTRDNCLATSCCVYAKIEDNESCYAGGEDGPTFKRDENGKTKDIDFYWYKNKCYGKNCEKKE